MLLKNADSSHKEQEYEVERIIGRRIRNGLLYYKLKWKGYTEDFNSWEPLANLNCQYLIKCYEHERKKRSAAAKAIKKNPKKKLDKGSMANTSTTKRKRDETQSYEQERKEEEVMSGFKRNLTPSEILGLSRPSGNQLMMLMKWKGIKKPELVAAEEANECCPQLVIRYYEKILVFHD